MLRNFVQWVREQFTSLDERVDELEEAGSQEIDDRVEALEESALRHKHAATDTAYEFYVDATSGDDGNAGTQLSPVQTIGEVYRRFAFQALGQARVLIHLVGNGSTQVTYTTQGLWLGGGMMADQNTFAFRGPAMIPFTPATGPNTAALDVTPCERVAQDQSTDVAGPRTKLSFTTAAPGWTTNDLAGSFLRIKRAGVPLTFEVPITENTADAIFVDHIGLVGVLAQTDTVEIVRPAVKILAAADAFSSQPLLAVAGHGGPRRIYDGTYASSALRTRHSTFERIEFGCLMAEGSGALCFDRCLLANTGNRGHEFRGFSVGFANTVSHTNTLIFSGVSTYAMRRVDQETQVTSAFCTDLQVAPPAGITVSGLRIGGTINDGGMAGSAQYTAQAPLSVYRVGNGTGIIVAGPGSQLEMRQSVGRILGRGNAGFGLAVQWGALARVRPASCFITGSLGDVKVNVGAPIAWGSGSGAFEDPATWNGDFCRLYDFYKDSDQSRVTTRTTTNTSNGAGPDNTAGRAPDITALDGYSGNAEEFLAGDGTWQTPPSASDVPVPATSLQTATAFGLEPDIGVENGEYANATHSHGTPPLPKLDELATPDDITTLDVSTSRHGLTPKAPNDATKFLRGDATWAVPTGVTPAAHAASHKSAGGDPIKLDELADPTDVATLNASSAAHGLLRKLSTNTYEFLRGDGAWSQAVRRDSIGTGTSDGLVVENQTAAANGAQQYSPPIRLAGQGWKTNSTAASQQVDMALQTRPVQGTAAPTGALHILAQINGGGYTSLANFGSDGNFSIGTIAGAVLTYSGGTTRLNGGGLVRLAVNNNSLIDLTSSLLSIAPPTALSSYLDLVEISAPAAPAANGGRLYLDDSGGKTRLMIRFNTGAAQQISIEP